ncbi:MAG: hypothetical protein D6828_00290 [Nitrospirae bacterium]|nr:MAG: hypothetical protein D6828_00290 [Nitrospirota bacterium]
MKIIKKSISLLLICLFLVFSPGCYRTIYKDNGVGRDIYFSTEAPKEGEFRGHIKESVWNHYFLFGLIPTSRPDIKQILAGKIPEGCVLTNLKIDHRVTFTNGIFWAIFAIAIPIYNPMTTTIEGDIICSKK